MARLLDEQDWRHDPAQVASLQHAPVPVGSARTLAQLEVEARYRVLAYHEEQFANQLEADEVLANYANVIANTYDPHTTCLAPRQKEDFDFQLTGRMESIGPLLHEKEARYSTFSDLVGLRHD